MWGVALTVGALEGLLVCATEPSRRWIAWTALLATLAVSARASVGLGAVGGTALLVAGQIVRWWLDRRTGEANRLTRLVGRLRRSEERRVGEELGRTCRSRWSPSP